jgi:hypothetical protein
MLRFPLQFQKGVSVTDSNRVGAKDTRYPVMNVLYTQQLLQESKLASNEEQGPDK